MDLLCTRCGEPWEVDYVLHEAPDEFSRRGGLIEWCPSCPKETPQMPAEMRQRLDAVREVALLLGNDIDGLASFLEDVDAL